MAGSGVWLEVARRVEELTARGFIVVAVGLEPADIQAIASHYALIGDEFRWTSGKRRRVLGTERREVRIYPLVEPPA